MRERLRKCHGGSGIVSGARGLLGGQRGVSLIEVLVAVAILGLISTAYLSALVSSSKTQNVDQTLASAMHLAQSQMEYVMKQPYAVSYASDAAISSKYAGYSVAISANEVNPGDASLQKIRVTVSHSGRPIIMSVSDNCTLADYRVET
jgi:prepilin-type N-terminal cleavage/methylation domain-containing protein